MKKKRMNNNEDEITGGIEDMHWDFERIAYWCLYLQRMLSRKKNIPMQQDKIYQPM